LHFPFDAPECTRQFLEHLLIDDDRRMCSAEICQHFWLNDRRANLAHGNVEVSFKDASGLLAEHTHNGLAHHKSQVHTAASHSHVAATHSTPRTRVGAEQISRIRRQAHSSALMSSHYMQSEEFLAANCRNSSVSASERRRRTLSESRLMAPSASMSSIGCAVTSGLPSMTQSVSSQLSPKPSSRLTSLQQNLPSPHPRHNEHQAPTLLSRQGEVCDISSRGMSSAGGSTLDGADLLEGLSKLQKSLAEWHASSGLWGKNFKLSSSTTSESSKR